MPAEKSYTNRTLRQTVDQPDAAGSNSTGTELKSQSFYIADPNVCYLDGNSLGRLPLAAAERLQQVLIDGWGKNLIAGWNDDWIDLPQRIGAKLAGLLGTAPQETIIADSTSVNLFKLATAALRRQTDRGGIVTDATNFPSDLYVLEAASRAAGRSAKIQIVGQPTDIVVSADELIAAIGPTTALVCLSHVAFRSGYMHDMAGVTRAAHDRGALVLWDVSHSVGAVPIDLRAAQVDLAVGCTYKYLCGGPGAPAFLFVREGLQAELDNPIPGWFSHCRPFEFRADYQPSHSIDRFLTGTPPVLSLAAIEAGVDLLLSVGIQAVRRRSIELTNYLIDLFDTHLRPLGFELRSPRAADQRGSHVSLGHPEARRITANLIQRHQVIPDFREPDNLRLGIAPLYNSERDVERAITAIVQTVTAREYAEIDVPASRVT